MSENDSQEKTQDPSEKRLKEAKEKGQIVRSKELMTTAVTLSSALALYFLGESMMQSCMQLFSKGLSFDGQWLDQKDVFARQAHLMLSMFVEITFLFMLICLASSLIAPAMLGGLGFNVDQIQPKLERLNPLAGLKRIFSIKALVELAKSFLKFVFIGLIATALFFYELAQISSLSLLDLEEALALSAKIIAYSFVVLSAGLILIAAIDVPFQVHQHNQKMKMSFQELKDEHKETEGSPELKQRLRSQQQNYSQSRSVDKVPAADVIITNPEHYAVALQYQQGEHDAPVVIAKGVDQVALMIREQAKKHKKPIVEAPPLARALYFTTDIGLEIPEGLYQAVAQVLSFIYQLDTWRQQGGNKPVLEKPIFDQKLFDY